MIDLSTLNDNQLEAVKWGEGPLLVLAGPGSGKTRVLTLRVACLIEGTPEKHFRILGLTFTNKAAAEMRERIAVLVPNAVERTLLTTFHSFAADLLRQHGHHIGLKPDFTILAQDADRHALLDEAIEQAGARSIGQSSERLLPLVTRLTENDIAPDQATQVLDSGSFGEFETLALVYKLYRSLMIERNALDFSGLIAEALGLLGNNVGVRKQIQRVYPYVCIDEFQDTNLSQYKMLQHLVNPNTKNLFVVADDDQIIYQWNGASPERLQALHEDFEMKLLQLPENYRCPPAVVGIANKLIGNNFRRFVGKGNLTAHKTTSGDPVISVRRFPRFPEEADWIAKTVAKLPPKQRGKCVVLGRTRKLLEQVVDSLHNNGVEGYLAARKNEFESASLQWLHSGLRLANSRSSRDDLRRLCKSFFTLEGIELNVKDIISHASAGNGDYLRSWAVAALNREHLSNTAEMLIRESLVPILLERLDFWQFQMNAFTWLDQLPASAWHANGAYDEYEEEKATWHQLVNEISGQYGKQEITLHLLLQELDLRSKTPIPPKDAIPCFTIHASKGMEFEHVFLIGLVEDQLPSWAAINKGDASREMQEERRNCFVAITRAQETLTVTYSDHIQNWNKKPSRFLFEMGLLEAA